MRFEDKIRCLSLLFHFNVTSWIRSRLMYGVSCGAGDRQHNIGLAVDISLSNDLDLTTFETYAADLGLQTVRIGDHIHVQEPRG